MPRLKRNPSKTKVIPPLSLNTEDADQKRFWEYYQYKTRTGHGADWIRETMIASIPLNWKSKLEADARTRELREAAFAAHPDVPVVDIPDPFSESDTSTSDTNDENDGDELEYVDVE